MNATEIINIVQSIGFPIVMCGAMGWFVYYMFNKNAEQIDSMTVQHKLETEQLKEAINNNTIALTKLIDTIDNMK